MDGGVPGRRLWQRMDPLAVAQEDTDPSRKTGVALGNPDTGTDCMGTGTLPKMPRSRGNTAAGDQGSRMMRDQHNHHSH